MRRRVMHRAKPAAGLCASVSVLVRLLSAPISLESQELLRARASLRAPCWSLSLLPVLR
jgi:hypothetical protein